MRTAFLGDGDDGDDGGGGGHIDRSLFVLALPRPSLPLLFFFSRFLF
jgi:hypothetical protein